MFKINHQIKFCIDKDLKNLIVNQIEESMDSLKNGGKVEIRVDIDNIELIFDLEFFDEYEYQKPPDVHILTSRSVYVTDIGVLIDGGEKDGEITNPSDIESFIEEKYQI